MRGARVGAYKRVSRNPGNSYRIRMMRAAKNLPHQPHAAIDLPMVSVADLNLLRHELRTPLTGILSLAELIATKELPGQVPCWLATLQACGQQMASLIDRSLCPDPITNPLKAPEETDCRSLLQQIICSHGPAACVTHNKLLLIIPPEATGYWRIDPVALRQAVDNLLANAIRFTRSGYVTLEVRVIPGRTERLDSLMLIVEDTGAALQAVKSNLQDDSEFADRSYPMHIRGQGLQVVEQVCRVYGGQLKRYAIRAGGTGFAMDLPQVLRGRPLRFKPFQPGLLRNLSCLVLLEKPLDRMVTAMLACLDICFEVTNLNRQIDLHRLPRWQLAICAPSKIPQSYRSPDAYPDSRSLWLVAPISTAKGIKLHVQQLPEPLLQADLQTGLLRCLVIQSQATGLAPEMPAETTQEVLE